MAGLAVLPPVARADLVFSTAELSAEASPRESAKSLVYEFENHGPSPVSIRAVTASCGCIRAATDKTRYAAGERGRVAVEAAIGARTGWDVEVVRIVTDEPGAGRYALPVKIHVLPAVALSRHALGWTAGAPVVPQVIQVEALPGYRAAVEAATVRGGAPLDAAIFTVVAGASYGVRVAPRSSARPFSDWLIIRVRLDGRIVKEYPVAVSLR